MTAPAILAKALFDNLADAPDELSFRKGDIITVLEQDVDGLVGWWLCSLHGKQGIAPGNRLQEIKRRLEEQNSPDSQKPAEHFTFEEIDYDIPKSCEPLEDYAVPRGITSPDYDVPNANKLDAHGHPTSKQIQQLEHQFNDLPGNSSFNNETTNKPSGIERLSDDVYDVPSALVEDDFPQDVYDVPQHALNREEIGIDKLTQLDNNSENSNVLDPGISRENFKIELPLHAPEEPGIYAEIYDVPSATDHEKAPDRLVNGASTSPRGSMHSVPQENRSSAELTSRVSHLLSGVSGDSKRQSTSSSDSAKISSDDDYVDYQEIYGDGRVKDVSIYDVPVQPIPLEQGSGLPTTKRTQVSILQRINMNAVKGLKLNIPDALQRLTKLEQAVNGAVNKLLSFVTVTWRNPEVLKPHLADIRDIAGKAKVALRLLTEFALSSLVNARNLPNHQELSGKLSRAVEPLLETYYSVKLALQRLDENGWSVALEKSDKTHDDLDLIMVHIRSVPENSQNLAAVIRTASTVLYSKPSKKSQGEASPSDRRKPGNDPHMHRVKQNKISETDSDQSEMERRTLITSALKNTVDANFKPAANGAKWSPTTVRRVCGMDIPKRNSNSSEEESSAPKLPMRLHSCTGRGRDSSSGEDTRSPPAPPQRKDSNEKCQHLRQKSLDKFPLEATTMEAMGPPPKPKLDRKNTSRKSYKIPLYSDHNHNKGDINLRERKTSETEPVTPRRKCNSDPTQLQDHNDMKEEQGSLEKNNLAQSLLKQSLVHISDSDLPQSLKGASNSHSSTLPLQDKRKLFFDFTNVAPSPVHQHPFSNLIKDNGATKGFMVSLNDRELLEFYKYEIDAQLFVLSEAIKGFFAVVDKNESPKVFVSSSKFIVLSAHKFVYIGDTLSKRIKQGDLRSEIMVVTNKLSNYIKSLVSATKSAALQYPALNSMREMSETVVQVNNFAVELYQIVKKTTKNA